jgi:hypothetical protein
MCGIAGLSIGCDVAPTCPKALLVESAAERAGPPDTARSPLASWSARASVRARPHPAAAAGTAFAFPRELVPITSHPLLAEREDLCAQAAARHLFRYLHFTAMLEHLVVNRTVLALAHDRTGFELPDRMRLDAYKIYVDEGYHALVAAELATGVARQLGAGALWRTTPYFLRRLDALMAGASADLAPLLEMLFVVCSETLISGMLSRTADMPGLQEPIRAALSDHAHDERRHHAYFAELLRRVWPQLRPSARRDAGMVVPKLIEAFLRPDFDDMRAELLGYGLAREAVEQVLAETFPDAVVEADRRRIARYTVRYFVEVGALEVAEVAEAFAASRLVDPAPV